MIPKILIIEDEGAIVDNMVYALKTEGFDTLWCSTGMEGLEAAKAKDITLVILDVGLPDINGFELFKDIKKVNNLPVIFLTARAEEIDRVVGLEIGADDYVTKPFSPRELTARVKAVLRRVNPPPPAETEKKPNPAFPFHIDEKKNTITYHGTQLQTSRYEFRILKILIDHPGWVYTREQLMEMAWDEPDVSLMRTVDAHIKNLRRKLKTITPGCDPIITHRGTGYAIKEDW
ncbi:MAG: two-component system response regulator CreB [bacterium]|nr:two-component system response regulator CreB [bacterium]